MIKAVLLDVGSVILDEDDLYDAYFNEIKVMLKKCGIAFTDKEFDNAIDKSILNHEPSLTRGIVQHFMNDNEEKTRDIVLAIHGFIRTWTKNHRQKINPGIKEAIAELSGKYRLALAGNQPSDVRKELDEHGILKSFALTKVSEDIGIAKPDPKFFEYILDKIAVKPKQSVMVGDRLDNDIIPAKKLGLKTILVKAGPYAILKPGTKDENPDAIIYSVTELPRTVETLSLG